MLAACASTPPAPTASLEAAKQAISKGLSQRRAEAVKSYLVGQGIGRERLTALGKGESEPLAGNDSALGRQQNRRVAVVIENPPAASR